MNKSVFLAILAFGAVIVVGGLFIFSPKEYLSSDSFMDYKRNGNENKGINIEYHHQEIYKAENNKKIRQKPKLQISKGSKNPYIKSITTDQYGKYFIVLIDKDSKENFNDEKKYHLMGKIDGASFVLDIPSSVVYHNNVKLKIIDRYSKKTIEIDAPFIADLPSIEEKDEFFVNLNTKNPKNVETNINFYDPSRATALPPL